MTDAATKVYQAIQDAPRTFEELGPDTGLKQRQVSNGLRNLLREGRVQSFADNGTTLYRVAL